jgi:hypothetical protein
MTSSKDYQHWYSFTYSYCDNLEIENIGWKIYKPTKEYARQNINWKDENCNVRLCEINKNFLLCATYPQFLLVPRDLNDDEIKEASNYRTKNRFPVLSYVYTEGGKALGTIWRSSQNKSGITQNRSQLDEKLLRAVGEMGQKMIIYDARPYLNALANRVNN